MSYIPLRKAVKELGLHPNTLRRYADEGKIKFIKNPAGQRLFDVASFANASVRSDTICYCRVSSSKQQDDLARQVAYMQSLYPEAETIKDVGSGLNFKRKGLRSILERLMRGDKLTLIVACKDRLARFGFELFQYLLELNGGKLVVLDTSNNQSPESELTKDLLAILHVFSCRMHGLRKYGAEIKKDLL
jgi:putative resolvase